MYSTISQLDSSERHTLGGYDRIVSIRPYTSLNRYRTDCLGVFHTRGCLNHTCHPNAQQAWDTRDEVETLHGIRLISKGREIMISYYTGTKSRDFLFSIFKFPYCCGSWGGCRALEASAGYKLRILHDGDDLNA